MDVTEPCEFIGFGATDGPKPYKLIRFFGGFAAQAGGVEGKHNHEPKGESMSKAIGNLIFRENEYVGQFGF